MSPTIFSVSVTERGRQAAASLPYEHHHGSLGETVRARWQDADALVLFCAVGIAVRVVGPLLSDKNTDPAVVAVDDSGRYVVVVSGGHAPGAVSANDLAREIAALIGAEPVITTATDATGTAALDTLPGFTARGDIAAVSRALLDATPVTIVNPFGWPLPPSLPEPAPSLAAPAPSLAKSPPETDGGDSARIVVTHCTVPVEPGTVALHPPSLVVGVGASSDAPATAASELLDRVLADHGLARESIAVIATIDRRANDPVVSSLGLPIRSFAAEELAEVEVPNPSDVVRAEVGTGSVAEAAALLAAGSGGELLVDKQKAATATVAIARRTVPEGRVSVVGLGPGHPRHRTSQAITEIRHADVVIGYSLYVDQCQDLLSPGQEVIHSPIGAEIDRCTEAVHRAAAGQRVALVCSGDPGVFAMATLTLEVAGAHGHPPVLIVPGVTAGLAAGAILGAPLAHDHALISLSDLLTPWPLIERRLEALAGADMAVALYNPRSRRRTHQLERAREIFADHRPASTPVGIVVNATRPDEQVILTTLDQLDPATVDMFSIVIIGSSTSRTANGRMVTPRGYEAKGLR